MSDDEAPRYGRAAILFAALTVGFHLYVTFSGLIPNLVTRPLHLAVAIPFVFFVGLAEGQGRWTRWTGYLIGVAGVAACLYVVANRQALIHQYGSLDAPMEFVVAGVLIVTVLEMARRAIKIVLPLVALVVLGYGWFGDLIPGYFRPYIRNAAKA